MRPKALHRRHRLETATQCAQGVDDWRIWQGVVTLETASLKQCGSGGSVAQSGNQTRLADARLTTDQQCAAAPRLNVV
jgi:hypothetical protein